MPTPTRRLVCIVRMLAIACVTLALTTPAVAQFGSLKKKAQQAAGAEAAKKAGDTTAAQKGGAPAPTAGVGGGGGSETVVLDDQLVDQFITGLKAGKAEREAAEKEDSPYARYSRDAAAYKAAEAKCDEAKMNFNTRLMDEKFAARYSAVADKMIKAQEAGDQKQQAAWADSSLAMMDPASPAQNR